MPLRRNPLATIKRLCVIADGASFRSLTLLFLLYMLYCIPSKSSQEHGKDSVPLTHQSNSPSLHPDAPSNMIRLTNSIAREDDNGIQQIVLYDEGLGLSGTLDSVTNGLAGKSMDNSMEQLYTFLALNYDIGDEIYLFGFARGAYTVRALAAMIFKVGLVRRCSIQNVSDAYKLYKKRDVCPDDQPARLFRDRCGHIVPIALLACFDTVAALAGPLDLVSKHDTRTFGLDVALYPHVALAMHFLSIDEDYAVANFGWVDAMWHLLEGICTVFEPTLMQRCDRRYGSGGHLTEQYFWGRHFALGGGGTRQEQACADVVLRVCVDEMMRYDVKLVLEFRHIPAYPDVTGEEHRSWEARGRRKLVQLVSGKRVRRIGDISALHPSALYRYQKCVSWRPDALQHLHDRIMSAQLS